MNRWAFALLALGWAAALWPRTAGADQPVIQYHNNIARSGAVTLPGLTPASAATMARDRRFDGQIPGQIRAQLLYWKGAGAPDGVVVVTTNQNEVAGMDPQTGVIVWRVSLGAVPAQRRGTCTTGVTTGILGTPVVDPVSGTLFLDTFMLWNGAPEHMVFALDLTRQGRVLPGWPISVADGTAALGTQFVAGVEGQRSALTLRGGTLYIPFASNSGECSNPPFYGYVVGIDTSAARVSGVWRSRAVHGGIWSQAGIVSDGTSLFMATGNTQGTNTWADGEAVLRLPPDLSHSLDTHDWFAPANWLQLDKIDMDLGATSPLPLDVPRSGGGTARLMLHVGKDGTAYLLDRNNLGGMGGALAQSQVAFPEVASALVAYQATDGSGTYAAFAGKGAACPGAPSQVGLTVLKVRATTAPSLGTAWCASLVAQGAPIVTTTDGTANPIVWIVGALGDGLLHGYDGQTGKELFAGGTTADRMASPRRFTTILAVGDRFYIGGVNRVYSFTYAPGR